MEAAPGTEPRVVAAAHPGLPTRQAEAAPAVDLAAVGTGDGVAVASRFVMRSWSATVPRSHEAAKSQTAQPLPAARPRTPPGCIQRLGRHHALSSRKAVVVQYVAHGCRPRP